MHRPWILPVVLVVTGAAVYANSLSGTFTFDDEGAIVGNRSIRSLSTALTPPERGEPVAGRPLVNLSFAINYALGGLDVRGYHIVNIALHVSCALLLFALVRRTLRSGSGQALSANIAFAAALIWVVHPLNTEAVNYVSQRTELLMALFYLLTLYANARSVRLKPDSTYETSGGSKKGPKTQRREPVRTSNRPDVGAGSGRPKSADAPYVGAGFSRPWVIVAVLACAAGMACKEVMVTAPVLVVLYDRTFVFGSFRDAFRARWTFYLALASTWLLLAWLIRSGPRWESAGFFTGISVWSWLLNQSVIIVTYLAKAFWPVALVFDYGEPLTLTVGDAAVYGAVVVALVAAAAVALWKWPRVGLVGAAFFIILAPTSSIIPIATEVGADRRMYLSLAALSVLVVIGGRELLTRVPVRGAVKAAPFVTAFAVLLLAVATVQRNADYRTELALWQSTLDRLPHARAHRNYATVLKRAGRPGDEIVAHLREGVRLGHPEGRYAVGFELYEQGHRDEAIVELRQFIRENPKDRELKSAYTLIGRALSDEGRHGEAIAEFDAALRIDPETLDAQAGRGDALLAAGRFDEAVAQYKAIVAKRPRFANAWANLGVALVRAGRDAGVREAFERAVELDPQNGVSRRALAAVLLNDGDVRGALLHAEAAVRLMPGDASARELFDLVQRAAREQPAPAQAR